MSIASAPIQEISEDSIPSDKDDVYEIVHGEKREKTRMGAESDQIIVELITRVHAYVSRKHGLCFSGHCGYQQIFADDPSRVRYPDLSYIRFGRLPGNKAPKGYMKIVPDLIVEVISPNDKAENVDERLTDFLKAGVPLAWLVYPTSKTICVFHQGRVALRLVEGEILDGEEVIPGFECPLTDLFADL